MLPGGDGVRFDTDQPQQARLIGEKAVEFMSPALVDSVFEQRTGGPQFQPEPFEIREVREGARNVVRPIEILGNPPAFGQQVPSPVRIGIAQWLFELRRSCAQVSSSW